MAWFLASYAREAARRLEGSELAALDTIRQAFEQALGLKFQGEQGDHFFRSSFVQTLFYGIFSAWVIWARRNPDPTGGRFNWHETADYLSVPKMQALFEQVARPSKLKPLGLNEVLDWGTAVLGRTLRPAFFEKFSQEHAVQYFYEPFLEAFDPELRDQLGVWYTPPEVVEYMVERVDRVLRDELGIEAGLADERVLVLDPCCGTGAYLIQVLTRIAATLREQGGDALVASDLKRAATTRVFGFEIMPAPFVVAHLQMGLSLQSLGAPLAEACGERAAIYLTNSLTGWEPPTGPKQHLIFREWEEERDAADEIKQHKEILVILGNPPYNGYAGVAVEEERGLSNAYRTTLRAPKPQGQGLNDLYVRFYRMAECKIVEGSRRGIVCFISNYSWLDGLSFTGMRERYLEAFDQIWIDCLNGDKYKTGKVTPWGAPDPSVFSTELSREGIQVGTAIGLLVRREDHSTLASVHFRHLWGKEKRKDLLASLEKDLEQEYETLAPPSEIGFPLIPGNTSADYLTWPLLPELFPVSFPGVKTSRDDFLVDIDRERLEARLKTYFDAAVGDEEVARLYPSIMTPSGRFKAHEIREYLLKRGFKPEYIVRYCYRPFDVRWLYWEPETKLLDEKRTEYFQSISPDNAWLSAGQRNRKADFYVPQFMPRLADHHIVESNVGMFPLQLFTKASGGDLFDSQEEGWKSNVSDHAAAYLESVQHTPEALFFHALGVLHAPLYRQENSGALRQDWPRIPLPSSGEVLAHSAALSRQVAALLDPEAEVKGVTAGKLRPEIKSLGVVAAVDGGQLDPAGGDLALTAGWGHLANGAIMPARGRVEERDYTAAELAAIEQGAAVLGLTLAEALALLGETTCDVYLNPRACWRNIPRNVWTFTIGGYQVIKKWLSYREEKVLGRALRPEEARKVSARVRRLAALRLLQPALDANYHSVKSAPWHPAHPPTHVTTVRDA